MLLLEHRCGLPLVLIELCLGLVTELVVNLDLVTGHLDVLFNNADLLLLLWSLKSKVVVLLGSIFTLVSHRRRFYPWLWLRGCRLVIFKLVENFICLQVNLVLLIELDLEADDI